ncbi:hypothetical protein EVJ22_13450 [Exiguobacterium sp. SH0S7]|uniref:hypothetical protein n=1 Tax=Exiguobacterium sp. SH0S7 TaxID=2510951 RepID=UPI00103A2BCF|nr:hypothetical protein [Exiguobacterium sp. SH0S7]TCI67858.1 hypothetical protein EVJ22_13450 [Exiguobacterium sp. SH0S7]
MTNFKISNYNQSIFQNIASRLNDESNAKASLSTQQSITSYKPSQVNLEHEGDEQFLAVDKNSNLTIHPSSVYSVPTKYGVINFRFNEEKSSNHVQALIFDNQMSDEKRVFLEKKRQFLGDFQKFVRTGNPSHLYTAREAEDVYTELISFGINTEEPFTVNNQPTRYRLSPYGVVHDVDPESKAMKEKDWRKYGHDENTLFTIQGKEYRMDENGRLPLPDDYVHKFEQIKITKR